MLMYCFITVRVFVFMILFLGCIITVQVVIMVDLDV